MSQWTALIENIARSSLLNTQPGSTLERDVQALIVFFNNTCTAAQSDANDAANPYRGAFAQISQWRQNKGWARVRGGNILFLSLSLSLSNDTVQRLLARPRRLRGGGGCGGHDYSAADAEGRRG